MRCIPQSTEQLEVDVDRIIVCRVVVNTRNDNKRQIRSDRAKPGRVPQVPREFGVWVNGWRKVSQAGLAYIGLVIKPKENNRDRG